MYQLKTVEGYRSNMTLRETERAVKLVKDTFEKVFACKLGLERISAPMFVATSDGINDDLNGVERAVRFDVKEIDGFDAEIVHSLAKWKRMALYNYGFAVGEGMYTDMNAIRRDDSIDNLHSIYVDQWDWEKVIAKSDRTIDFLQRTVRDIVNAIVDAAQAVQAEFLCLTKRFTREVTFISSEELLQLYPTYTAKERENAFVRQHKTVFLTQIGGKLSNGNPHDGRAPDYDDWALNGDLFFWDETLQEAIEISSMGIRVDAESLRRQLIERDKTERLKFDYHKKIIDGTLPLTIGGGIGQSRLCLLILEKLHVGEVQVSIWPKEMIQQCHDEGIQIL